ncbi:hypothetical protein AVEN_115092-1 [Araneus ventricosus]|uniref:Uncharacterized protein n=1 Tax=Araneus ventricosus TaxID=182803 RepID=A0A4Y1ZX63_ARAVE|nr:hypothetical protein AVEN_115092-1 [Araneus ventricosus]
MQGRKCNPNDIGGCLGLTQKNCRQPPAEMLGRKIGIQRDRKLIFQDHKRKISHDFPDNEVARSFLATCLVLTIFGFARLRACHSCINVYSPAYQR